MKICGGHAAPARRKGTQDITAYVIVSVVHYLVVAVGFGLVAFLIYHDKRWIPMLVATVVIALLCQSSYSSRTHATCPLCGHEFVVQEHEKCE